MKKTLFSLVLIFCLPGFCIAVPNLINYQGTLTDSLGNPVDGSISITFKLFDVETGGTELWSEVHPTVQLQNGTYNVLLGSVTAFPSNLFENSDLWLEVAVAGETLTPRMQLASVPFSLRSSSAMSVDDGAVTAAKLSQGSVSLSAFDPNMCQVGQLLIKTVNGWTCQPAPAYCGNSLLDSGETCDAGGESATCDVDCTIAVCGDGVLNVTAGELCDDGTQNNTDACLDGTGGGCVAASCGDGYIYAGVEACDDGNDVSLDGCENDCTLTPWHVVGMPCSECHVTPLDVNNSLLTVNEITFSNGVSVNTGDNIANLCGLCHQGNTSKAEIDNDIDTGIYVFHNVGYRPASATSQGAAAQIGYEYDGNTYSSAQNGHIVLGGGCKTCHISATGDHRFSVIDAMPNCTGCHTTAVVPNDIRVKSTHLVDFDGDGSSSEPLTDEISGLALALLAQIQSSAMSSGPAICYDAQYPFFYYDTNANGICDGGENSFANRYDDWSPGLIKAAHNYHFSQMDIGAWAHSFDYMAQLLYDSIEDLGGDVSGLIRPVP